MEPIIQFSGADILSVVIYGLDMAIFPGDFVYIVGKVGSGKTSIIRTMTAENRLTKGTGTVCGFDLRDIRTKDIPMLRRRLGVVFQDFQLLMDRSVEANLEFVLRATGWKDRNAIDTRITEVLADVGMETKAHKMPHQLSGGEQQRIAIARALLNRPQAILADEPTGNLDGETADGILKLLRKLNEEGTAALHRNHRGRHLRTGPHDMTRKERFAGIVDWFEKNVPIAETELHYGNPYQLLVAVILSAQCTDRRVNVVTPPLFERFPTPQDLASASFDEVYPYVKSVSYPNSKTEHLIAMAQKLLADFNGEVPSDIDALMTLPGVGRKTANVIASVVYDKPVIAVDTHVFRVSHRLGLSNGKTPLEVERDLERHIPEHLRARSHHWLILHGRYTCTARAPKCAACGLTDWCKQYAEEAAGTR